MNVRNVVITLSIFAFIYTNTMFPQDWFFRNDWLFGRIIHNINGTVIDYENPAGRIITMTSCAVAGAALGYAATYSPIAPYIHFTFTTWNTVRLIAAATIGLVTPGLYACKRYPMMQAKKQSLSPFSNLVLKPLGKFCVLPGITGGVLALSIKYLLNIKAC